MLVKGCVKLLVKVWCLVGLSFLFLVVIVVLRCCVLVCSIVDVRIKLVVGKIVYLFKFFIECCVFGLKYFSVLILVLKKFSCKG